MSEIMLPKLTEYLQESGRLSEVELDELRYEYGIHLYYYGDQFSNPFENSGHIVNRRIASLRSTLHERLRSFRSTTGVEVQSNAYSTFNRELGKMGYVVGLPPWMALGRLKPSARRTVRNFTRSLREGSFFSLLSGEFAKQLEDVKSELREYYRPLKALVVPYDLPFYENMSIRLFRELRKPSFVFLHGLPGRYNRYDDARADYLLVWGERIKSNYVRAGVDPDKILVTGHPELSGQPVAISRNTADDILVIAKTMQGNQSSTGRTVVYDRSDSVLYLYLIEDVLKRQGICAARFRPHPSESGSWYQKYIDTGFYRLDAAPLKQSLNAATLVIGPASTVLLEAMRSGVNYQVFEPSRGDLDIVGRPLVPPFDGSDDRLPVALDATSLEEQMRAGARADERIFQDYVHHTFDLTEVKKIVG
jgi:hypothetical protein